MGEWTGWFEDENGQAAVFLVNADSRRAAIRELARLNPDDVGADGEIVSPDGTSHALDW